MGRARRILGHGWRTIALGGTFVASVVASVSLHANTPAMRRLAASITNDVLSHLFEGRLVIEDVQQLSIAPRSRVRAARATILDPDGRPVIVATGIAADIRLDELLASLAAGEPPTIDIGDARVDGAEVVLDLDASGKLGIARAFHPPPKPPKPAKPAPANAEDVRLKIARAYVHHAWVHGNVVPPALDGDADEVRAHLAIQHDVFSVTLDGARTTLRSPHAPGQADVVRGDATGELSIPLATGVLSGHADLHGDAGGVPIAAHAGIANDTAVDASIDVARAEPAAVARLLPSVHLARPVELHATAKGTLPVVTLHATAKDGAGELDANGDIDLREGRAFHLDVDAKHVDASIAGGPSSDVSAHAHAEGDLSIAPSATFHVTTVPDGRIAGQRLPEIVVEGRFEDGKVDGTFRADEPGAQASGRLVLDPRRDDLSFDVQARSSDLRKIPQVPRTASGAASARAVGHVDLAAGTIHARATADGDALAQAPIAAGHAHAEAVVDGPVTAPVLDVTASGDDVRLQVDGKEPLSYPHATAHARVTVVPRPRLENAVLDVSPPGAQGTVTARAEAIDIGPSGVVVRGGRVSGLGAPIEADMNVGKEGWTIRAKADDVDVHRAAAITGIRQLAMLPEDARAKLDVDVSSVGAGATGHADVAVESARGLAAEAHLGFAGRHVTGTARGEIAGIGAIDVPHIDVDLPGPPDARSFARATGVVEVNGTIDLSHVDPSMLGKRFEQLAGTAFVEGRIERGDPSAPPSIRATVRTRELEATLAPVTTGAAPKVFRGIDLEAHAEWDGRTDDAEVYASAWDAHGVLASADAKTRVSLAELARTPPSEMVDAFADTPIAAVVDVPGRRIDHFPTFVIPAGFAGGAGARGEIDGTIADPRVVVTAWTNGLREKRGRGERYEPIDGTLEARWNGERFVVVVSADERESAGDNAKGGRRGRETGHVRGMALGRLRARDALHGTAGRWSAWAEIAVDDVELSALPLQTRLRGALTARARLRDLGGTPSFEARGHVDRFAMRGARLDELDVAVKARDASLEATASALDGGRRALVASISSRSPRWRGVELGWNADESTRVDYQASGLRLALLQPFARQVVSDVDGRIDGRGSATFDSRSQKFEGGITLSDGRAYLLSLGEDISDVQAVAQFEPNGVFRIEDATGKIGEGTFRASAAGRMKGLRFVGATANVVVPSKQGIPLASESVTFAEVTGEIKIDAKMSADRETLLIGVDVPRATFELPGHSTPNVEPLAPDETITIGIRGPHGKLTPVALKRQRKNVEQTTETTTTTTEEQEFITRVTISLGKSVTIEGKDLNVQLGGRAVIDVDDEVKVEGRIDLRGGSLVAHGRRFTIDHGAVTFPEGGDPSNPTIVAAAYWDAPDRTRIWVEFAGPLKTGKLTLRSEPPFSKNEILSILLFGRPDPNMATAGQTPSGASGATAIGTGFVATDINRALSELDENLQVETDTLSGNRTRTKLGYRVGRSLRVQLGIAPGASYQQPDTTFLFLDWQFLPKLSLVATEGNRGTSILDVIFQHRY